MASTDEAAPWGRVDEDGTVSVREGDEWRAVGQYPDATPDEALAYYTRKFTELEGQVTLLEQRARGGAHASDVAKAAASLAEQVHGANAVGDLASLSTRLGKLQEDLGELTAKQSEEAKAAVAAAVEERQKLVAAAEAIAARDLSKVQWKQVSAELEELFATWQSQQQSGPRIPKKDADDLWKRFRAARTTVETERKAFFAQLDNTHKDARDKKQSLIDRAEALADKGSGGIAEYRTLLDEWKTVGHASKKADDALWARFKAAGDVLYSAKAEADAKENEEFSGNLAEKLALLDEAEKLLAVTDAKAAKDTLRSIQLKWDAVGKVPRDQFRAVEDRIRKVEAHVRKLEDDHWNRTNPAKQERSEGFAAQLDSKIAKLEQDLAAAKAAGDTKKAKDAEDALAATRIWRDAVK